MRSIKQKETLKPRASEAGVTIVEYIAILALVLLAAWAAWETLGDRASNALATAAREMSDLATTDEKPTEAMDMMIPMLDNDHAEYATLDEKPTGAMDVMNPPPPSETPTDSLGSMAPPYPICVEEAPAYLESAEEHCATETARVATWTAHATVLTVELNFPCYTGPGPAYNTLSTLKAGTELQVVGYGFGGGWLVAQHPTLLGQNCWIDEDFVTTNVPIDTLRLISIPPKPTAKPAPTKGPRTPQPTTCYYNQQQQLVCQ